MQSENWTDEQLLTVTLARQGFLRYRVVARGADGKRFEDFFWTRRLEDIFDYAARYGYEVVFVELLHGRFWAERVAAGGHQQSQVSRETLPIWNFRGDHILYECGEMSPVARVLEREASRL